MLGLGAVLDPHRTWGKPSPSFFNEACQSRAAVKTLLEAFVSQSHSYGLTLVNGRSGMLLSSFSLLPVEESGSSKIEDALSCVSANKGAVPLVSRTLSRKGQVVKKQSLA